MSTALNSQIRNQLLKAVEQTNAQEKVISAIKSKVIDLVSKVVEEQVPIPLPIDVKQTLEDASNGQAPNLNTSNPEEYLTPEVKAALNELDQTTKDNTVQTLESTEQSLESLISPLNSIQDSLIPVKDSLNSLNTLANTVQGTITGLSSTVSSIKFLPIPVSTGAPGVPGVPLSVPNTFSDTLDSTKSLLDSAKGTVGFIPPSTDSIIQQINGIESQLNSAANTIQPAFDILIILIAIFKFGEDMDPTQLDELLNESRNNISNIFDNLEDITSLNPSLDFPILYKGYELNPETNLKSSPIFPQKRIVGKSIDPKVIPNIIKGEFSFTTSLEILVKETKFLIDSIIQIKENDILGENNPQITEELNQSIRNLSPLLQTGFTRNEVITPITPEDEADSQQQLDGLLKEI